MKYQATKKALRNFKYILLGEQGQYATLSHSGKDKAMGPVKHQ